MRLGKDKIYNVCFRCMKSNQYIMYVLVRAALSMKIHAPLGSLEIEAKAMEEGMHFA